jgi:hypothetical protein
VKITDIQDIKQTGKEIWDTNFHTVFSSGKECGIKEARVVFIEDGVVRRNSMIFAPVGEMMCSLCMRTDLIKFNDNECLCTYRG